VIAAGGGWSAKETVDGFAFFPSYLTPTIDLIL
jgi:hypothetical protein